jgi:hypothetical protein
VAVVADLDVGAGSEVDPGRGEQGDEDREGVGLGVGRDPGHEVAEVAVEHGGVALGQGVAGAGDLGGRGGFHVGVSGTLRGAQG